MDDFNFLLEERPEKEVSEVKIQQFAIEIAKESLLASLTHLYGFVDRKTSNNILSHVKLSAYESFLELTTNDMELLIKEVVEANVKHTGSLTVSVHLLHDIVKKMPSNTKIIIQSHHEIPGKIEIICGKSYFTLSYLDAEKFPILETDSATSSFKLSKSALQKIIDKNYFCICPLETRYNMNGIFFHKDLEENFLRTAATDAHRLSTYKISLPQGAEAMKDIILPKKTVGELRKIVDDAHPDQVISVNVTDNKKVSFQIGSHILIISKLIDGVFPEYQSIIPKDNDISVEIEKLVLLKALDRVTTIINDKTPEVKLSFSANLLKISALALDNSFADEELPITYDSVDFEIGVNARYISEALAEITSEKARFGFKDESSAILVNDLSDENLIFLIMPVRINHYVPNRS